MKLNYYWQSWKLTSFLLVSILFPPMVVNAINLNTVNLEKALNGGSLEEVAADDWKLLLGRGDLIGNGAGLGEMQFSHMYHSLPQFITTCLNSRSCLVNESHRGVLLQISKIARKNRDLKTKLIFLSSKEYPNFFRSENDPETRIAKTGFRPDIPVFINIDQIYEGDGSVAVSSLEMMSILLHEVGHQTGERSHSYLNDIAVRVQKFLNFNYMSIDQNIGDIEVKAEVFNFPSLNATAKLFLVLGSESLPLSRALFDRINCRVGRQPIGYQIVNLHWEARAHRQGDRIVASLGGWLDISCIDRSSDTIWDESRSVLIKFSFAENPDSVANDHPERVPVVTYEILVRKW